MVPPDPEKVTARSWITKGVIEWKLKVQPMTIRVDVEKMAPPWSIPVSWLLLNVHDVRVKGMLLLMAPPSEKPTLLLKSQLVKLADVPPGRNTAPPPAPTLSVKLVSVTTLVPPITLIDPPAPATQFEKLEDPIESPPAKCEMMDWLAARS